VRAARNFLAGLSSSAWSALVTLICVPFYLRFLGLEAYGLVGFFVLLQSLLQLLDLGIAPTVNREVARATAGGDPGTAAPLLRPLAVIVWSVAAVIALAFAVASPLIGRVWLNPATLSPHTVEWSAAMIGVVIAARWPMGLYQGVLLGAQLLTTSSAIAIAMTSITSFCAIAVLAFVSPTIEAFFAWQALAGIVYTLVMRRAAWRALGSPRVVLEWRRLAGIWRFSAGMSLVAVSAIVLMQLDKVILSSMLDLADFASYTLAVLIASSLYIVLRPLFNTIYPKMSALVAAGRREELADFHRIGTRLLCSGLIAVAAALALFAQDVILLWTRDAAIAERVAPLAAIFVIGTALNGVMHFPYALQLAHGLARLPLEINVILIAVLVPTTIVLARSYGALGGAAAWLVLNTLYLGIGAWLTHRALPQLTHRWLSHEVAVPCLVCIAIVVPGSWLVHAARLPSVANVAAALVLAGTAFAANVALTRNVSVRLRRALA